MTLAPILVVGGAGYIGSHMVLMLAKSGYRPVVLDNLDSGRREAVGDAELIVGDVNDDILVDKVLAQVRPQAVLHFASSIEVGESVVDPAKYYRNNVNGSLTLLDGMHRHGVDKLIFSSTAAIFGTPLRTPIDESHPALPINPYGRSKWMVEQMLDDFDTAYGMKSVALRYFNAAGADPEGRLGECHDPESHLIPLVLQAASGRRSHIAVYGDNYPTPDGTCVRDYVHVVDLCSAHLLALNRLLEGGGSARYNLGNGNGFSVNQVIETAKRVSERDFEVRIEAPRLGDPAVLIADSRLARRELGWTPRYDSLETIIRHAWNWETSYLLPSANH